MTANTNFSEKVIMYVSCIRQSGLSIISLYLFFVNVSTYSVHIRARKLALFLLLSLMKQGLVHDARERASSISQALYRVRVV